MSGDWKWDLCMEKNSTRKGDLIYERKNKKVNKCFFVDCDELLYVFDNNTPRLCVGRGDGLRVLRQASGR